MYTRIGSGNLEYNVYKLQPWWSFVTDFFIKENSANNSGYLDYLTIRMAHLIRIVVLDTSLDHW